ncbi:MAG: J domain-containing protein [Clostridiales bacterium]|nr:J domain-containing protein [Clostridiales bacterium]
MKGKRDYYEILGVTKDADAAVIKRAYRKLAKKYHPDSNKGNQKAEEVFKEITEAYGVLGDEKKRKLYDQYGFAAFDETGAGAGYQDNQGFGGGYGNGNFYRREGPNGYQEFHFEGNGGDMDDILKNFFGGSFHGSDFGSFHGFRNSGSSQRGGNGSFARKGMDLNADMEVTFDEAAFGGTRKIHLQESDGTERAYEVHIPAGIASGQVIRMKGKGNPGSGGGENGDLMLKVTVKDKPGFHREGQDVYTTVRVPFATAVLGGEVTIGTIYGDVRCNVKAGTQSGSKIRLRGKGIASMDHPQTRGDQFVTVQIEVPRNLGEEEKRKLREFDAACERNGHTSSRGGARAARM